MKRRDFAFRSEGNLENHATGGASIPVTVQGMPASPPERKAQVPLVILHVSLWLSGRGSRSFEELDNLRSSGGGALGLRSS